MSYKNLILIRHSYAEAQNSDGDFERKLSNHGLAVLNEMLYEIDSIPIPEMVYVSAAKRTKMSFEILNKKWQIDKPNILVNRKLYLGGKADYLNEIALTPQNINTVAIVGHNPTITQLAFSLYKGFNQGFAPANLMWLRADTNTWELENQDMEMREFIC